ncbi:MAG: hypothetical protein RIC87_12110 [Kiloniellales bacterium]
MTARRAWQYQIAGWSLFILSGMFFLWSTAAAGDPIGFVASLLFLVACPIFLAPLIRSAKRGDAA